EAVETLRRVRRGTGEDEWIVVSAADPANLASLGDIARVPAVPNRQLIFRGGEPVAVRGANGIEWLTPASEAEQRRIAAMFAAPLRPTARRAFGR
ncbi:MAG TPA: hypothetical protein VFY39_14235, partial [Gammaproteobacteria bacterium]|nr:hypothetical protein [Gammaproteobacteria bacterium]